MRTSTVLYTLCLALAVGAAPAPAPEPAASPDPQPAGDNTPEIIEIIAPAASAQETLSTLNLGAPGSEVSDRNKRTIGILRQLFPQLTQNVAADENQLLSGAESQQAEVRVAFGGNQGQDQQVAASSDDQQTAAQTNSASIDEISLDDSDAGEENRNKRFLSFGGSGGSGGSGGGSGNFLFDIVRLVAGSSSGSAGGDANVEADGEDNGAAKGDNLTEGVPGPITRLFIIANRGVANLIQDLILRLAQTSERIVNFKARLITSII